MLRRITLWTAAAVATALFAHALARTITLPAPGAPTELVLTQGVSAVVLIVGILICVWYFLTAVGLLVGDLLTVLGASPAALLHLLHAGGAPLLRRAAAVATISVVAASPTWAAPIQEPSPESVVSTATHPDTGRNASFLVDLGWAITPPPAIGVEPPAAAPPEPSPVAEAVPPPAEELTVTVADGDTLWGLVHTHLSGTNREPTPADVAAEWPRWYSHNAAVIGPDPDLLLPGTTLRVPPLEER